MLIVYLYVATTVVALSFDGIHDTSLVVYFLLIAIKFAPSGSSVLVAVEPQSRSEVAKTVRLLVHDSGPGIPPELEPMLFQKFASGDQKGSGSGLGLAFCRLAVEAHGGRLWLAKERTPGTTFAFTIPATMNGGTPSEASS